MRHILPLRSGGQLVAFSRSTATGFGKAPLSLEDFDLLNAYARNWRPGCCS